MRTPQAIDEIDPLPGHAIEMDRSRKALGILSAMWREEYDVPGPALRIVGELAAKCADFDRFATASSLERAYRGVELTSLDQLNLAGATITSNGREPVTLQNGAWIDWHGGECPVDASAAIEVRKRSGLQEFARGYTYEECWRFGRLPTPFDITAYRVVQS